MKRKNDAPAKGPQYGRQVTSFLVRVQLCEERIRMQLTDVETRVGAILDLLRARCPGYRIEALCTFDGCELEERDKIFDVLNYGECLVATAGKSSAERMHLAVLSSFGLMSCMPRPCIVPMPSYVSIGSDFGSTSPCVVPEHVAESLSEIFVAINGYGTGTVMVPVRLRGGSGGTGNNCARLVCRGGVGADSMRRIEVVGGKLDDGAVLRTVHDLQEWVRVRCGVLSSWCHLYTHICSPPARAIYQSAGEQQAAKAQGAAAAPAATGGAWWGNALEDSAALPVLTEGQRLVVCTKSYGVTVTDDIWPVWKGLPLNLTGPSRLRASDKVILDDPIRHEEISMFLLDQQLRHPWLKLMQRCGTTMLDGSTLINDEVSFASVLSHSQPPSANSAGRIALKIVARLSGRDAIAAATSTSLKSDAKLWKDESVWAALPAHAHVLTLLFTAGPQVLFCPYMDSAPVAHWLTCCPVHALATDELLLVFRTVMLQAALALQHFHDHGALHLEVTPQNLLVRPCSDMRKPLWMRMHVLLADFGLSSTDCMAGGVSRSTGGVAGYWPPEQVPLDSSREILFESNCAANDRWGDCDRELQFAFEMFVETVYVERARQLDAHKNTALVVPDFPQLPPKSWAWFKQMRGTEAYSKCSTKRPGRPVAEDIEEELRQVLTGEDLADRRTLWRKAVYQSHTDGVTLSEHADSFSLAMTMLHLVGICIRSRVNSPVSYAHRDYGAGDVSANPDDRDSAPIAEISYFDIFGYEWDYFVNDELGCIVASCLRLKASERMLSSKVAWYLSKHPPNAEHLWRKMAGNDSGPWKSRYADEPLCDQPPLLDVARARVYACTKLLGEDSAQTRRAQLCLMQLLLVANSQVLPDLSVKDLKPRDYCFELSRISDKLMVWFAQHGPQSVVEWYKDVLKPDSMRPRGDYDVDAAAKILPRFLPPVDGYRGLAGSYNITLAQAAEKALPGRAGSVCATYDLCCYVRAAYLDAVVADYSGRKVDALQVRSRLKLCTENRENAY